MAATTIFAILGSRKQTGPNAAPSVDAEAKVQRLAHPEGTVRYAETDFPDPFSPAKKQIREVRETVSKLRITGTPKG
jgi:hypothetical protein